MENDRPYRRLAASARQIMDVPEEEALLEPVGPLYITWFALGHAAVLLYLALYVLRMMTPMERALAAGAVTLVGLALALLLRGKVRTALAMAEVVGPNGRKTR